MSDKNIEILNKAELNHSRISIMSLDFYSFKKRNEPFIIITGQLAQEKINNTDKFLEDYSSLGEIKKNILNLNIYAYIQELLINSAYNIFMYFQPLLYLNPQNCYYFSPIINLPEGISPIVKIQDLCKKQQPHEEQREIKIKIYLDVFRQQIMRMRETSNKKCWTQEQDQFLLNLDESNIDWKNVASQIPYTNDAICQRRFNRLKEQRAKWPKEIDYEITRMHELQKKNWNQIKDELNSKYISVLGLPKFTSNKIKERYNLYLRPGICRDQWTVDQDIQIIRIVKEKGKDWTKELKSTFTLKNRTELQIKNRYFGTLKFLQKKVFRKASAFLKMRET